MADTWILVADRARARLFSLEKGAAHMDEIEDFVNVAARVPGHAQGRAPPPRAHDRLGESRHVIEAHTSPREKSAHQFAATLAAGLEHAHAERRYGDLVMIAPPGFLGVLNTALGAGPRAAVVLTIAKNMTRVRVDAIRAALPPSLLRHMRMAVVKP